MVQAGCLLGEVDRETQLHGLATPLGFVSEVGVAGLTLGGGLGYLTRRFGWTVDNLLEVEIVTADGQVRRASRDENADLFWAIRGAGANLGVVTSFTFRLHEVGPTVYGGLIAWPFERAAEILRAYRTLTSEAPRELAVWMNLLRAPAAPFVPAGVARRADLRHGRLLQRRPRARSTRRSRRSARSAIRSSTCSRSSPTPRCSPISTRPSPRASTTTGRRSTWPSSATTSSRPGATSPRSARARETQMGLLHLGGALNEHDADDGAVGNRDARYACGALGMWEPDEPGAATFPQWVRDAWERFRAFSTGGNYINLQTADEDDERIRATYGANFERLRAIKQQYDPGNVFRSNRNIQP